MNYKLIYASMMQIAASRTKPSPCEKHHIVPKSLSGTDDLSNLVYLTPREHFIAHKMLTRFTVGLAKRKMISAYCYMAFTRNNKCLSRSISSRDYEHARIICKNGMYTDERNKKISVARKARIATGWKQIRTTETKSKHSNTLKNKKASGHTMPEYHRAAISKGLIGNTNYKNYKMPEAFKNKLAEANSRKYRIINPGGVEFTIKNLSAWLRMMNCNTCKVGSLYKKGILKGYTILSSSEL